MDVKFSCSHCGQHIAIDESCSGRWVKCPVCDKPARVPGERKESISKELLAAHSTAHKAEQGNLSAITARKSEPAWRRLWQQNTLVARLLHLVVGWSIGAALLGAIVVGFQIRAWALLPKNFNAMVEEIYRDGHIRDASLQNHGGTALVYARNLQNGVGIFLVDLNTLKPKQLTTIEGTDVVRGRSFSLFGWSPGDRYLAYSIVDQGRQNRRVVLCDGATGEQESTFDTPGAIERGVWLSANSLAMMDSSRRLFLYNILPDGTLGQYGKQGLVQVRQFEGRDAASELVRVSDRAIAYVNNGNIWYLDIPDGRALQLTHLTNATLSWIDFNPRSDEFLFCAQYGNQQNRALYRFNSRAPKGSEISRLTDDDTITFKGQWVDNGAGYAFVGAQGRFSFLVLQTLEGRTNISVGLTLRSYSLNPKRDKAYMVAAHGRSPLGIWECDLTTRKVRNVVPPREFSPDFSIIAPVDAVATTKAGEVIPYYYLPPRGFDAKKRYPVVIDPYSDQRFQENFQTIANCGAFVVSINRFGLASLENIQTAYDDTLSVYNELLKNPNVDPKRIYLMGNSRATYPISQLVNDHPDYWRGAILCSPLVFPRIPADPKKYPSIFISIGDEDEIERQRGSELAAQEARRNRIPVQIIYAHSNHDFASSALMRERYRAVARFIVEGF